ncbi:MAG: PIN domain-containing protein [Dermatophilaceae bacterium]
MTVLDAYAVIAFLRGEPGAGDVAPLLDKPTVMSTANAAEVIDQLVRVWKFDADDVHGDLALLAQAGMQIIPVSADEGLAAGRLRASHYHRERCAVSLADCIAVASALARQRPLATADPALAAVVRAEGGTIVPIASSSGATP